MTRDKLDCARKLVRARSFILVTESESLMYGEFTGVEAIMQLHALKEISRNLTKSIKNFEKRFHRPATKES